MNIYEEELARLDEVSGISIGEAPNRLLLYVTKSRVMTSTTWYAPEALTSDFWFISCNVFYCIWAIMKVLKWL